MTKKDKINLKVLIQKRTQKQYPKFFIIGAICVGINLLILYILTEFFGIYYIISAIFAMLIASSGNFIFNKTWTFNEDIEKKFIEKYVKFYAVKAIVFLIGLGILYTLTEFLHVYYLISQLISIAIIGAISFVGQKLWTFKK